MSENKKNNKKKNKSNTTEPKQSAIGKLVFERLQKIEAEKAKIKALEDEEERKRIEEELKIEAEKKRIEEEKELKKKKKQDKILEKKKEGTYLTKSQKDKLKKNKSKYEQLISLNNVIVNDNNITILNDISKNNKEDIEEDIEVEEIEEKEENNFRSIITCIMGHVDTGKTKLLDKIRGTNVQDSEAGGITQQIGATFIPINSIFENINDLKLYVPGLLMIDTPGHEAFKNLRTKGSSLCDISIIVVDIVHGLEPQTIESINILIKSDIKFIIALNKIDRLYNWKKDIYKPIQLLLEEQDENCKSEFNSRLEKIIVQIMELGLNAKLFWNNDSVDDTVSICPISAITGQGINELLNYLITYSQENLTEQITYTNEFKCIVMDTTNIEGFGSTIDVILIDGELEVGDKIALSTLDGPIITTIRNLLTPPPNRESRIKSEYIHHTKIKGSMGIKIFANNLIKTLSGTSLLKITNNKEDILEIAKINCDNANKFILQNEGVTVHSSTLGSLEALVYFLQNECNPPIPISKVNIGKVMKKDIIKTYLSNEKVNKEYSVILAFNVEIDEDAVIESKNNDIKIFSAEIIYHLFDQFKKYKDCIELEKKEKAKNKVVFPCILKIMPDCIFNKKNPLVLGVEVIEGNLHLNTPLYIPSLNLYVGKVIGIQNNKKDINIGKKNSTICIKIENEENPLIYYGRHFDNTNNLYSKISRESIDVIKEFFRNDITNDDIQLLGKLKKVFAIN